MGTVEFFEDHNTTAPMTPHMNLPRKLIDSYNNFIEGCGQVNRVSPVFLREKYCIFNLLK
jgi:hypothetical protein